MYCHREAFDIAQTERPRHATEIAAGAAEYDTVIALGGDGVAHEVACGLMRIEEGRRPTLGVIPVGSGNDFARTLGLTDVTDVSGTDFSPLLTSSAAPIDVLEITCRSHTGGTTRTWTEYAVQTISFGLDAAIAIDTHAMRKITGLTGAPLYLASGLKAFGRDYRDFPAHVRFDGGGEKRVRAIIFAIQNGPTYGSGFRICPQADPCDGLLDVCYATGPVPRAVALPSFSRLKTAGTRTARMCICSVQNASISYFRARPTPSNSTASKWVQPRCQSRCSPRRSACSGRGSRHLDHSLPS